MKVQTYDAPQVELRPLPGVRQESVASPGLFSAGAVEMQQAGRGLLAAGSKVSEAAVRIQERENADMIFRAETALKDEYLKFEDQARQRRGQNAWGLTSETDKWWSDAGKKHSEALGNDLQRQLFGNSVSKLRNQSMGSMAAYESEQRRRSLEESARASIVSSINFAAALAKEGDLGDDVPPSGITTDETEETEVTVDGVARKIKSPSVQIGSGHSAAREAIDSAKRDIIARVQVLAQLNGWDNERRQAEEAEHLTNFHKQIIQAKIEKDPKGAKAWFTLNKQEINGSDHDAIEKALDEGTLRVTAQEAVDDMIVRGLTPEAAIAEAREKHEGKEEDEIVRRVKEREVEQKTAVHGHQKEASDEAWRIVVAGGGRGSVPVATWNAVPGEEQRQIVEYIDARRRRAEVDAEKEENKGKDDIENLDTVERLIEQGDITDKSQLGRYEPYFTKSTLKTLRSKIDKRSTISAAEMRRNFEDRIGKSRAKWGEPERAQWMAFQEYILENVRETKRPEDMDVWADRWFMKGRGTEDSVFTNDPDTFGEARTKGRKDFIMEAPESSLPTAHAAMVILRNSGVKVPATENAANEFYTRYQADAERWLMAHEVAVSPTLVAAYALLRQNNKPITPANLAHVAQQLAKVKMQTNSPADPVLHPKTRPDGTDIPMTQEEEEAFAKEQEKHMKLPKGK